MHARVAARHFWSLQVQLGQFPRPTERLTVRHNFCNHSPFVCSTRRQRPGIEQEGLRSPCSTAITPRGVKAPRRNTAALLTKTSSLPNAESTSLNSRATSAALIVLDVAQGMGLRASEKVRFARGPARNRRWCVVEHPAIDWASRSLLRGSSK